MTAPLNTYQDPRLTGALRESLYDVITTINPTDTPFMSGLEKGAPARSTYEEWLVRELAARGGTARVEGASISYSALTAPSRNYNYTLILYKDYQLSRTMAKCNYAGGNPLAREIGFATLELKNDMEYQLINGSARGAGTDNATARTMYGALPFISTNAVTKTGESLDAQMLNKACKLAWDNGGKPTECYVGAALKSKISSFTVNNTRTIPADDKRLVNNVTVYEGDFATLKVLLSHDMPSTTDAGQLMLIDPTLWNIAFLDEPHKEIKANSADVIENGIIVTEFTLRCLQEKGNAKITGLSVDM